MDRTTIMLPQDLKIKALNQAKKMGMSLGQFIRETLETSLNSEDKRQASVDPLFLDTEVYGGESPRDLSSKHDEYLYGDRK